MRRLIIHSVGVGVLLATAAPLRAQDPPPSVVPASGRSIRLEGLLQIQAHSSPVDSVVDWDGELRRIRLTVDGDAGNGLSGRIMVDADAERARVRDAYVEAKAGSAVRVRVGQFKPPF